MVGTKGGSTGDMPKSYSAIFGQGGSGPSNQRAPPVSSQKYVPPHLRGLPHAEDERLALRPTENLASGGFPQAAGAGSGGKENDRWHREVPASELEAREARWGGRAPEPRAGGAGARGRGDDRGGGRVGGGFGCERWGSFGREGGGGRMGLREEQEIEELFKSSLISTGINFEDYFDIPVQIQNKDGADLPKPLAAFEQYERLAPLLQNIARAGYTKPTPIQKHALPIALEGYDMMGCAQTGSGKTGAFLFPMIVSIIATGEPPRSRRSSSPRGLVLAPTRELVQQIYSEARKFAYHTGIVPAVAYGGAENRREQVQRLEQGADLIVAAPGRLVDFIECGKVSLHNTIFLVLDEADRMLDMGFEPQIRNIVEESDMPGRASRQTLMFSATFPKQIQRLAHDFMRPNFVSLTIGKVGSATGNIQQKCLFARSNHDKPDLLVDLLSAENLEGKKVLIFVETKRGADVLEAFLEHHRFMVTSIHGDRTQKEREAALASFRVGREPILVATDVAARGLDIPNVTQVVNFDMPQSIDDYVHRIGRTGRAGNPGQATVFLTDRDGGRLCKDLIDVLAEARQEIPPWLEQLSLSTNSSSSHGSYGRGGGGGGGGSRRQQPQGFGRSHGDDNFGSRWNRDDVQDREVRGGWD